MSRSWVGALYALLVVIWSSTWVLVCLFGRHREPHGNAPDRGAAVEGIGVGRVEHLGP